jgi:hypothetical protein
VSTGALRNRGPRGSLRWTRRAASLGNDRTSRFADTWGQAAGPLLVMTAWTCVAVVLARRSMRWEPRA